MLVFVRRVDDDYYYCYYYCYYYYYYNYYYPNFYFTNFYSIHLYESAFAKHEDLKRVFAGRTNALPFTPSAQLIDARNCYWELFTPLCVRYSLDCSHRRRSLLPMPFLTFLFFLPHIHNIFNLHSQQSTIYSTIPLRPASLLDHHCTKATLMLSI